MSIARHLAERIVATRLQDVSPEALRWSKVALLDTVGVMLAGAREDAPRLLGAVVDGFTRNDGCLVYGSGHRAAPLDAALVNATAAHALDFDNTAMHMGGHASATMIPALLAAGEMTDARGRDLLLAHVVGYEVGGRLGRGVNFHHTDRGWHPTWTLGVFAVTAACARLLALSVAQTETALGLATSLAGGTKANFGTMTKPLHAGQCARSGLMAAMLAGKGYTANPEAFEHKHGFLDLYNGAGRYDIQRVIESWGSPYDIVDPGASYKLYPCCYSTHSAVEAALELVGRCGAPVPADAVERVEIRTAAQRLAHTDRPDPRSELDAKFSIQYCVARALLDGKVVLEHFEHRACAEPAAQQLLQRTRALPYVNRTFSAEDPFDAEVTLVLRNGTAMSAYVEYPLGRTAANPIAMKDLEAKFGNCAGRRVTDDTIVEACRLIDTFEAVDSVRRLAALLERGSLL